MIRLNKISDCFIIYFREIVLLRKEEAMESKIRIKLGPIEVEYEGSETFLKKELPDLIKTVTELAKTSQITGQVNLGDAFQLTTSSIAAKLSCSKGPDLVIAAAAHLSFVQKVDVFSRKQLLNDMKSASGYYKSSYRDNLSSYLKTLLKTHKLTEPTRGHYSLDASESKSIGGRLAN